MQMATENGLDGPLQFEEGEAVGHELENYRPVFDFRTQPAHGRRQYAAVVELHRRTEIGQVRPLAGRLTPVCFGLQEETGLVEQLIAVEDFLIVPAALAA